MPSVRIISGLYRGRVIPFANKNFNDADITSQKVKGAVFSILGEDLEGRSFLDLFAGSGQMSFEALSRGAGTVIANEPDRKRREFIESCAADLFKSDALSVLGFDYRRAVKYLSSRGARFDCIYLDPPYIKEKGRAFIFEYLMESIDAGGLSAGGGMVLLQHFSGNPAVKYTGALSLSETRKYGSTSVSIFINGRP
ncbi:MAG: RsmD family RNA methyltransferase [Spirochaetes bacterium]|jgi:16S rRNA (guanine(966)-N(2))-methyltransferase RsmD|nr:RsmD family RNA methyltransferase [Spirochaetota bacterium]